MRHLETSINSRLQAEAELTVWVTVLNNMHYIRQNRLIP